MVSMAAMGRVKYAFDDAEMDALTEYEHLHGDEQQYEHWHEMDVVPASVQQYLHRLAIFWQRLGGVPLAAGLRDRARGSPPRDRPRCAPRLAATARAATPARRIASSAELGGARCRARCRPRRRRAADRAAHPLALARQAAATSRVCVCGRRGD